MWVSMTRWDQDCKYVSLNYETETEKIWVSETSLGKICRYRDSIETLADLWIVRCTTCHQPWWKVKIWFFSVTSSNHRPDNIASSFLWSNIHQQNSWQRVCCCAAVLQYWEKYLIPFCFLLLKNVGTKLYQVKGILSPELVFNILRLNIAKLSPSPSPSRAE